MKNNKISRETNSVPCEKSVHNAETEDWKWFEMLYLAVDVNHRESIIRLLDEMLVLLKAEGFTEDAIKVRYLNLYVTLMMRFTNEPAVKEAMESQKNVLEEIYRQPDSGRLHEYLKEQLLGISDRLTQIRPDGMMKKIVDYIGRNYAEPLKLKTLAEIFNYHSAYLGKLFKEYTGFTFHTYLDRVRLEKAQQLLREGLKVGEVARMVGYNDMDYFYEKFKKYTGVSPSTFKESPPNSSPQL